MTAFVVHPDKIVRYLLNPTSAAGASKARFFMGRGFDPDWPAPFAAALARHGAEARLAAKIISGADARRVYECEMAAADGTRPCIRSIWIERDGVARLITAYPIRQRPAP